MNVFEFIVYMINSFDSFGNFIVDFLFTPIYIGPQILPGVELINFSSASLAAMVFTPVTLALIWGWQTFKAIVA